MDSTDLLPIHVTPDYSIDELQFFNMLAMSNFGGLVLIITDQQKASVLSMLSIINNTTQFDVVTDICVLNTTHEEYIDWLLLLRNTPPLDLNTRIVRSCDPANDVATLYENDTLDIIVIAFKDIVDKITQVLPSVWNKLKSNGSLVLKGIDKTNINKLNEISVLFGNFIKVPSNIRIQIHLIEQSTNTILIKKPCYV
uniref:Uncharacterized protein n=1 Tax=viral metagenome TaxID=1070528 RepID=A0A6C0CQX8_9ZZZZ